MAGEEQAHGAGERLSVLIVDAHAMFAESLVLALTADDRIDAVGYGSDGLEGVTLAQQLLPDVVLMDLDMPRLNGVDATRMLSDLCPSVRVIVVTASCSAVDHRRSLEAGAARVVTKDTPAATLQAAVLEVSSVLIQAA